MTSASQDEGFHEIQLNGKQLVFLFMAGTVAAVVIFLLGVFVGRGVRAEIGDTAIAASDLPKPVAAPPAPASVAATEAAPPTVKEDLTYARRLEGADRKPEKLEPTSTPPPPTVSTATPPAPAPTAAPTPAAPAAPTAAAAATTIANEPAGEGFSIQVAALPRRDEAEAILKKLASKGYPGYVVSPASATPFYRVRVGKYKSRSEAESVSARLKKEEQFNTWIVR